jgi:hypothetical protein
MNHKLRQLFASTVIAFILTALVLAVCPPSGALILVRASNIIPQADLEYANGTLTSNNAPFKVWYNWVNVSNTQVIYYAAYTTPDYPFPVPIANIIGQHFSLDDGTKVFVASALSELEVYRDLNGDGIPQTSADPGENEILYYIYSNMSQGYSMAPLQKTTIDSVPHYQWSFTYQNAYAYLQNANARVGIIARMFFEHLTLNYDFSVKGNVSDLKTGFDIGKVTNLEILEPSDFSSFDGLSLALLYTTGTYTSKPYSTAVNGQQYNSSTAGSAVEADVAEVKVEDVKAYDFLFGGNYTLYREGSAETHGASVETYEAQAQAVPVAGLPTIYGPTVRSIGFFADYLSLADLFGGSWPSVNSNYELSSLIYRICFPVWDGMQIEHDPTFLGYIYNIQEIPEIPTMALIPILILIASSLALILQRKYRLIKPWSRKLD